MALGSTTRRALYDTFGSLDAKITRVADWISATIRSRTRMGISMHGTGWAKPMYSKKWAKHRGRSSPVDLYDTATENRQRSEHMLDTFGVTEGDFHYAEAGKGSRLRDPASGQFVAARDVWVGMSVAPNQEGVASAHQYGISRHGDYPQRPWMGLTDAEERDVADMIGYDIGVLSPTEEDLTLRIALG
jgi:hypothetical protein